MALLQNSRCSTPPGSRIRVALLSASVATVLGTLAAITLVRFGRFKGRTLFSGMIYAPLVMPDVISGLSLLLLFVAIGFARGFWTVMLAHITFRCASSRWSYSRGSSPSTAAWKKPPSTSAARR